MNFKYFNYKENILKNIIDTNPKIYIFDSSKDRNYAKLSYKKKFGEKESLFFTLSELKENIFLSNKIVLREEKPALVFYNCLTKEIKNSLKINNYYDVIDTAYNFINFYKEIKEYDIQKIENLENWQNELLKVFDEIKTNYDIFLDEKSYTLPYLLNDFSNYNPILLNEYTDIIFVNVLSFTPFEKQLLSKLEENFNITLALQLTKGDFDEKSIQLIKISIPQFQNIEVFELKDSTLQLINLISTLENISNETVILDQNIEQTNYDKLISSNKIKFDKPITLENTKLFNFLSLWYELLCSIEFIGKEFCVQCKVFLKCLNSDVFQTYYDINKNDYKYFLLFIENDYKYISINSLNNDSVNFINIEKSEKFIHIIKEIEKISKFQTLNVYTHFLENEFEYKKLDEINFSKSVYEDNIAKYFESLSEVLSIEDMNIIKNKNWNKYFKKEKISENLLKLILKYLREKQIKPIEESVYGHFIASPENYPAKNDEMVIYLNINNETLPSKPSVEFLLTDKQRELLGLPSYENTKLIEKYKFFRNIFSSEKALIFSIKNEEKNIDRSSFLEELILSYNLEIESHDFSEKDTSLIIEQIFYTEHGVSFLDNKQEIMDNKLPFSRFDYKDKKLMLGSYDYMLMMKCYYSFFLDKTMNISSNNYEISYKIDAKLLGLIVHSLFEKLSRIKEKDIKKGNFSIEYEEIENILNDELSILKYKLPVNFNNYYKEVLFPIFINNAKLFYELLKNILGNEHIHNFSAEKSKVTNFLKDLIEIDLSGRLDLLIESEENNRVIDYKTGKGDAGQLDFYSILLYDNVEKSEKLIYNAWEGKFIPDDRSLDKVLTKDILEQTLKEFIHKGYYKRTKKKSNCMRCPYINICRQRWEEDE